MKVLVGAFNQEKALVGAFSVIVKTGCGTDGSFYSTNKDTAHRGATETASGTHITESADNRRSVPTVN